MCPGYRVGLSPARELSVLYLEAKPGHASLILVDDRLAIVRGIVRLREQHAIVALRFLILAHAAWLHKRCVLITDYGSYC